MTPMTAVWWIGEANMSRALRIHPQDNVAVALEELMAGSHAGVVSDEGTRELLVVDTVPFGHKVAVEGIAEGADVLKYGVPIGFATRALQPGEWVHQHNTRSHFEARREAGA